MPDQADETKRLPAAWLAGAVLCVIAALGGLALFALGVFPAQLGLSVEATADYIRSWGAIAGLVVAALMVLHTFLPFPAEILAFAAGLCLGSVWVWSGAMLGAIIAFALARLFGRPLVARLVGEARAARLDGSIQRYANAGSLVAVRFVPVISFNLVNFAAGMTGVGWFTFLWTTAIGILPLTFFMVLMGERMREPEWIDLAFFCGVAIVLAAISIFHARRTAGHTDAHRGEPGR